MHQRIEVAEYPNHTEVLLQQRATLDDDWKTVFNLAPWLDRVDALWSHSVKGQATITFTESVEVVASVHE